MARERLRIAVITDLHYVDDCMDKSNGFRPECSVGQYANPMEKLIEKIEKDNISADYLLCPGDITNKADYGAFNAGWESLRRLKSSLKAEHLIASTGNHEVDSRQVDGRIATEETIDPVGELQKISDYPANFEKDPEKRWVYWGRGYQIFETANACVVILNSCHFHVTMNEHEYRRGKISKIALDELEDEIRQRKLTDKKFRLVLLHHHPVPHQDLPSELGQIDMYGAPRLIDLLEKTYRDWVVIHGHKHHPRLLFAQGSTRPPVIFAAGAFGALLKGVLSKHTKNQFYVLNLEAFQDMAGEYRLRGNVSAYFWSGTDWKESTDIEHGLPHGCGFSSNVDISSLSASIVATLKSIQESGEGYARWDELCVKFDELNYLTPTQIEHLKLNLSRLGVELETSNTTWFPDELAYG